MIVGSRHSRHRAADRSLSRDQWRLVLFCGVLVVYLILTLLIVFKSPLLTLDSYLANQHMRGRFPGWRPWIFGYVMLGQRGPATLLFLPYFLWTAWRRRSTYPIVLLVTALVLLNLSVGVVKLAVGRLGPRDPGAHVHDVFAGGSIYPSGHVSNAVVLYGLIAMLVVHRRRLFAAIAVFLSVTVGIGTIYLDTHWFSDVVGGWIAGALVLIALPWVMPYTHRWTDSALAPVLRRLRRRRAGREDAPAGAGVSGAPPARAGRADAVSASPADAAVHAVAGEPDANARRDPIPSG